jgi:hypothetical protein
VYGFFVLQKSFLGMAVCGSFYVLYYLCGREKGMSDE